MPAPMMTTSKSDVGRDLVLAPGRRPPVLAADRELLFEEREVRSHVGAAADRELHDLQELGLRRRRRQWSSRPSRKRDEHFERELPGLGRPARR